MAYKNAGIKNIREAITRLMDGEVFYSEDETKVFFNDKNKYNPFRYGTESLSWWSFGFAEWQVKTDWRDNVSVENPVLCWVSDDNETERVNLMRVISINYNHEYIYKTIASNWRYATPVKLSEIKQYIIEE